MSIDPLNIDSQLAREMKDQKQKCSDLARAGNIREFAKQFAILIGYELLDTKLSKSSSEERYRTQGREEAYENCILLLTDVQQQKESRNAKAKRN